jgi:hypothetical protein
MKKCVVCNESDGVFMNTASGGIHLCEPCFTELRVAIATHGVFGPVAVLNKRWPSAARLGDIMAVVVAARVYCEGADGVRVRALKDGLAKLDGTEMKEGDS